MQNFTVSFDSLGGSSLITLGFTTAGVASSFTVGLDGIYLLGGSTIILTLLESSEPSGDVTRSMEPKSLVDSITLADN